MLFRKLAQQKNSRLEEGHLLPDLVHMMISIPPKYAVAQVIGFIKGKSAIHLARAYGGREQNFVGQSFWARAYFVSTAEAGRGVGSRVHPHAGGRRGQALRSGEDTAVKRPPLGSQQCQGRVSDPAQPL